MNKSEKINYIIDTLELLFPEVPIPLDHKDPYTLLIAVLLSAQSTDIGVNKVTPILFKKADNPYDMVKLSVEEIRDATGSGKMYMLKNWLMGTYRGWFSFAGWDSFSDHDITSYYKICKSMMVDNN